jgi:hypothetical protein
MPKLLKDPKLFTQQFSIRKSELDQADLLDPFLNADTKLFIDPLLLRSSKNATIKSRGVSLFRKRVSDIVQLVMASRVDTDPAWKAALRLLDLHERRETCLGYGGSGVSGSSRPDTLKTRILKTTHQVLDLGITNPEIISLMGIFEDDVGPDTISDLTTNAIFPALQEITLDFCKAYSIPTKRFAIGVEEYELPTNPLAPAHGFALVPKDILRELPVATDWSDIDRVVRHNAMLRDRINKLIANIAEATIKEKKRAIKAVALSSSANFQALFNDLLAGNLQGYDFDRDKRNLEALRYLLENTSQRFPLKIAQPAAATRSELKRIVSEIVGQFKRLVENNDLSGLLWDGSDPKPEKAAQLVFFGVADSYCKANNIDISPEVHSGGGPVDFKFSSGYEGRLLVEIKLSKGKVEHGYKEQLEVYKAAAQTDEALFLIIDIGGMGQKLKKIQALQKAKRDQGRYASEITVVDAKRKASASKRVTSKR